MSSPTDKDLQTQTTTGYERMSSVNPKRQPGSLPVGGDVDPKDMESRDGAISDNYPQMPSKNMTNRLRPEVTGQNERGYVQTSAGNIPTTNTSAGRLRSIPNP